MHPTIMPNDAMPRLRSLRWCMEEAGRRCGLPPERIAAMLAHADTGLPKAVPTSHKPILTDAQAEEAIAYLANCITDPAALTEFAKHIAVRSGGRPDTN